MSTRDSLEYQYENIIYFIEM